MSFFISVFFIRDGFKMGNTGFIINQLKSPIGRFTRKHILNGFKHFRSAKLDMSKNVLEGL